MLNPLLESMRPTQWTKNVLIFAALFFSRNFMNYIMVNYAIATFIVFCAVSSAVYIINDLIDVRLDRVHPLKKNRPIASGKLKPATAFIFACGLCIFSLACGFFIKASVGYLVIVYILLHIAYSYFLKYYVIFDVLSIAFGFVIRAVVGGVAISVPISPWLLICTFLLALFIVLGKRRAELILYEHATHHRPILEEYSPRFLDQMISISTASTLIAYSIYTLSDRTVKEFGTTNLIYTIPFVAYGLFRYLYIIYKKAKGDYPEKTLFTDMPLLLDMFFYAIAVIMIIHIR